ncbi:MAG: hypothetical protein CMH55_01755 [Myxococcales bacterium]|nr:hypothetical protein [Myxococcales bacterium]
MRSLAIITVAFSTLLGLEMGLQGRDRFPLRLPTHQTRSCPYTAHEDSLLGYGLKSIGEAEPGQKPELLLVGDSIVAGDGYKDPGQSLVPRLQKALDHQGMGLHVRGLAVPGYNLSQQLRLLELELQKEHKSRPHGILLTLNAGDADAPFELTSDCRLVDASAGPKERIGISSVLRFESLRRLLLAKVVLAANRSGLTAYLGPQLMGALKPRLSSPRWQQAASHLNRVKALASEREIPIAVLIFPYSAELTVPPEDNSLADFLTAFATEQGLPSLRLVDRLAGLGTHEAFLDGNALHLSPIAYDRVLPDITRLVDRLK